MPGGTHRNALAGVLGKAVVGEHSGTSQPSIRGMVVQPSHRVTRHDALGMQVSCSFQILEHLWIYKIMCLFGHSCFSLRVYNL